MVKRITIKIIIKIAGRPIFPNRCPPLIPCPRYTRYNVVSNALFDEIYRHRGPGARNSLLNSRNKSIEKNSRFISPSIRLNDNERGNSRKSFRLENVLSRCRRRKKKFNLSDLVE